MRFPRNLKNTLVFFAIAVVSTFAAALALRIIGDAAPHLQDSVLVPWLVLTVAGMGGFLAAWKLLGLGPKAQGTSPAKSQAVP